MATRKASRKKKAAKKGTKKAARKKKAPNKLRSRISALRRERGGLGPRKGKARIAQIDAQVSRLRKQAGKAGVRSDG